MRHAPGSRAYPGRTSLGGFDGIRAAACLWVMAFHLFQKLNPQSLSHSVQELQSVILLGNIGVSIFFVLSGALLSFPFWSNWLSGDAPPSLRGYAIKRLSRIAPGFYLSMVVSLVFCVTLFGDSLNAQLLTRFVAGITFLSSFHWVTFFPVDANGPLWSIGFEVFAYLLLALQMAAMFRYVRNRTLKAGMLYWLGVAALCVIINLLIVTYLVPSDDGRGWQYGVIGGAKLWMPWYNPVGLFNHFLIGVFAAGFLCHLQRLRVRRHWVFDAMVMVAFAALGAYLLSHRHTYTGFDGALGNIYFWPWFPLEIGALLCLLPFSRVAGRALDNRFMRYVAKISFGLYIWHALIIAAVQVTLFPDFGYMAMTSLTAWMTPAFLSVMLSFAVATLSYKYVEHPALRWGYERALGVPPFYTSRIGLETEGRPIVVAAEAGGN